MGIKALPNTTVRALGASQVLNDPASVVKELLDNAIDARATSVSIEIANNTVDFIQVRDNGHGVPPEDRPLVAKPHCTSKITCEDDLNSIGGSSLGFRGEAIASIAEMSSTLTISTRVEGEQVAVALKINKQGDVLGEEKASFPVGTTIKITGFVKDYPVRNQNALKNSEKCLRTIKQLLKSYAFARQQIRLSLRVHKAKNDKTNWTYAPKTDGNAEDAAFKIVGAACASQCMWSVLEDQGFTIQAFLPKIDGDPSKITSIGAFLSVDNRPVSSSRGTPKQIVKIFREAMKQTHAKFDGVKEPFMYLEITCPASSYDANVEPAKDDVLFENPDIVMSLARRLFDTTYPPVELLSASEATADAMPDTYNIPSQAPDADEDDFITSLEPGYDHSSNTRRLPKPAQGLIPDGIIDGLTNAWNDDMSGIDQLTAPRTFRSNMCGCDEEDLDIISARPPTGRSEAELEELRQVNKDVNVSNPWVMAKLNAAARRPPQSQNEDPSQPSPGYLPTPRPSSPLPPSQDFYPSQHSTRTQQGNDGRSIGSQILPPPQGVIAPTSSAILEDGDGIAATARPRELPGYDYALSAHVSEPPRGTSLHAIPSSDTRPRRWQSKSQHDTNVNEPFKPPSIDQPPREKVWFDHLENDDRGSRRKGNRRNAHRDLRSDGLVEQGELGDFVEDPQPLTPPRRNRDMRDFLTHLDRTASDSAASLIEARNYPQRRSSLSEARFGPATDLAGSKDACATKETMRQTKRRRTSEARAMREISGNARAQIEDEEYRPITGARTSSRRSTRNGNNPRRLKSSLLPLERTPIGKGVHHLISTQTVSAHEILRLQQCIDPQASLVAWNGNSADLYDAFDSVSAEEMQDLAKNLNDLLIDRVSDGEMVQDLEALVENALSALDNEA